MKCGSHAPARGRAGSCRFFFKQKTACEIPKRDWSSDVCSSDLGWRWQYDENQIEHGFAYLLRDWTNRSSGSRPLHLLARRGGRLGGRNPYATNETPAHGSV